MTLGEMLHTTATARPQKTAVLTWGQEMNYQELDESTTRLARWFVEQGLQPGDRVAIHWPNSPQAVQLFFAVFKAGLIAVPVNVRLKPAEIAYVLDHSQAVVCFSHPSLAQVAVEAGKDCRSLRNVLTDIPADLASAPLPDVDPDRPAVIMYTSGTTARPKGVVHSHRSLMAAVRMVAWRILSEDDTALSTTSMMHASGLYAVVLPAVMTGATVVTLPAFNPGAMLDAIEQFGVTFFISLPALMQFVVEEQARNPRRVSSLHLAGGGGDTVSVSLQNRFQELFGIPLRECYGMTETFPITINPSNAIRQGSMGTASPDVEVRIVDLSGHDVPCGETGELVVSSVGNCLGYWNDPKATWELFRDGWLHTGDLAARDADGYYWFKGRRKQIIIRGGSNISPQEVESALCGHPAVLEAGVFGQPDDVYGETVAAAVALRPGTTADETELREFAREFIADYKVPERILFLSDLPKGPTGKVDRRALKEMAFEECGLTAS